MKKNIYVIIFIGIIVLVGCIGVIKLLNKNEKDIYVKIKVSQGTWWAYTQQPQIWYAEKIKSGLKQKSLSGQTIAEIVEVKKYPSTIPDQLSIYLVARIKAEENKRTGILKFNRQEVTVASPIELSFPSVSLTGIILDLSGKPFQDMYITKQITVVKEFASADEFDGIKIGSSYFDGNQLVLTVTDKEETDSLLPYNSGAFPVVFAPRKDITVKMKVKTQKIGSQLVFGEEQLLQIGGDFLAIADSFKFNKYQVRNIE